MYLKRDKKSIENRDKEGIQNGENFGCKLEKQENICYFRYTYYPHLWAPERGKFGKKNGENPRLNGKAKTI